jgi:DNA-binding response OmpR family regulator
MAKDKKLRVLVADDEKPLATALKLKLDNAGFETIVARDGAEAIEQFKSGNFAMVLLDLIMPKKDGFEALEEIRRQDKKVPIFVLSNLEQQEDINRALKLGANGYHIKSNTPISAIVETVKKQLK